ncbi:SPOR domain-containing protein, partial [Helicobacter trogontum]
KPKDSEKTDNKKQNDNIIPKPQNNVISANQGKAPEQGYYLQVGVFTQTPAQSFLNKIAKYNYRVLKTEEDGVAKSKYLIGPYISKNKAKEAEQKVREEVESKANVIFYQRQAK